MNKVLIITGASRGIGAAIARKAAAEWKVCINYRSGAAEAEAVAQDIIKAGGEAMTAQADIGSEQDVKRLFDDVEKRFGAVTGVVNNAAITAGASTVRDITLEQLQKIWSTNILGTYLCAREAMRRMSDNGGQGGGIVNVGSVAVRVNAPGIGVHYAMSKAAVETFTRGLAMEAGPLNIRVNAVSPAVIDTDMHASVGLPNRPKEAAAFIPMRRAGQPDEVAEAVLWLLSDKASYVTGSILEVSGGR